MYCVSRALKISKIQGLKVSAARLLVDMSRQWVMKVKVKVTPENFSPWNWILNSSTQPSSFFFFRCCKVIFIWNPHINRLNRWWPSLALVTCFHLFYSGMKELVIKLLIPVSNILWCIMMELFFYIIIHRKVLRPRWMCTVMLLSARET